MSCRRAEEMDLLAFAAQRASDEWGDFRDHYPRCPECSRAVAELTELTAQLAELGEASGHLSDDRILAVEAGELVGVELRAAEAHLSGCPACRSELAVLRSFELLPAVEALPSQARAGAERSTERADPGWLSGFSELVGSLFQPAPALGLAAVVALAVVVIWSLGRSDVEDAPTRYVEQPAPGQTPSPLPDSGPSPEIPRAPEPLEQLAEGAGSNPLEDPRTPPSPLEPETSPSPGPPSQDRLQIVESAPEPGPAPRTPQPDADPTRSSEPGAGREVMLLAALLPSELPRYALPADIAGAGLETVRASGALRGADGGRPRVSVLAPEQIGLTGSSAPRLYWVVDRAIAGPVEIVVDDPIEGEPLLEKLVAGPFAAGLHRIDLADEGVALRVGRDYAWSVAVVLDADARESDVVSQAAIRRAPADAEALSPVADAERARRVHRLAAAGHWYDAFDQTNRWLNEAPSLDRVVAYRRALLDQVALAPVIGWVEGTAAVGD